jgi:hypothetical protein
MTDQHPNELRKEACMVITNLITIADNIDFKMMVATFGEY